MSLEIKDELHGASNDDVLAAGLQDQSEQLPEPSRFARLKGAVTQILERSGVEYLNDPTRGPLL